MTVVIKDVLWKSTVYPFAEMISCVNLYFFKQIKIFLKKKKKKASDPKTKSSQNVQHLNNHKTYIENCSVWLEIPRNLSDFQLLQMLKFNSNVTLYAQLL